MKIGLTSAFFKAALLSVTLPIAAHAFEQTYFGQDAGLGEDTRLGSHPNSDAARAAFLSVLSGVGTETFEGQTPGATSPIVLNFAGSGIDATLFGDGSINNVPVGTNGFGRYPISGEQYWGAEEGFAILFSAPTAAFGFYGVDIGDFDGQVTLSLLNGDFTVLNIGNSINVAGGGVLYFGYATNEVDKLFTAISFGNTNAGTDFFAFDDMTVGNVQQVVPPSGVPDAMSTGTGLAAILIGMAALQSLQRRKKV